MQPHERRFDEKKNLLSLSQLKWLKDGNKPLVWVQGFTLTVMFAKFTHVRFPCKDFYTQTHRQLYLFIYLSFTFLQAQSRGCFLTCPINSNSNGSSAHIPTSWSTVYFNFLTRRGHPPSPFVTPSPFFDLQTWLFASRRCWQQIITSRQNPSYQPCVPLSRMV